MFSHARINEKHLFIDYYDTGNSTSIMNHNAITEYLEAYTKGKFHYHPTLIIAGEGRKNDLTLQNSRGPHHSADEVADVVTPFLRTLEEECDIFLLVDFAAINGFAEKLYNHLEDALLTSKLRSLYACHEETSPFDLALYFTTTRGVENYKELVSEKQRTNDAKPSQHGMFAPKYEGHQISPLQGSLIKGLVGF